MMQQGAVEMQSFSDSDIPREIGPLNSEIAAAVRSFVVENFLLGRDNGFGDDDSLLDSGIIDSTGIMQVVAFLEGRFALAIDDDDLTADNLDSVARIAAFVERGLTLRQAA